MQAPSLRSAQTLSDALCLAMGGVGKRFTSSADAAICPGKLYLFPQRQAQILPGMCGSSQMN
jgi:hypothetical protein